MTAIVIVPQPKYGLIHVAGDAASYGHDDHIVSCFSTKVLTVPEWPGLVTNIGNGGATVLLGWDLAKQFSSFDDLIENAESYLPTRISHYGFPTGADVFLVGISEKRRAPEAYLFRVGNDVPLVNSREEMESSDYWPDKECELLKLPGDAAVMSPVPSDQIVPAHYEGIDVDADPEEVLWGIRKMLEMQHQMTLPPDVGAIGGFGQVTTISADGIQQRVLQRWPEDQVGTRLKPAPIDWKQWHWDNPKPTDRKAPLRLVH